MPAKLAAKPPKQTAFLPARTKIAIGSLDNPRISVHAQYNPKEVQLKRTVPWTEHDDCVLEFTGTKCRTYSVELFFDGYEAHRSVAHPLAILEILSIDHNFGELGKRDKRPHHCVVAWGDKGMPKLCCVIESVVVKYTMFDSDGTPLRATATVELKEAWDIKQGRGTNKK
jgi:hypothetical protein